MSRYEQIYNGAWIFLAMGICGESIRLSLWDAYGPGSGFIPFLTGLIIGVIGLLLFMRERSKGSREKGERFWHSSTAARRIIFILGGLCLLAFLMPVLGFLLTSFLITTFMLRVIEPQKWVAVIATSLLSCFAVYWLFSRLLQVSLPKGFFGV